MGSSIFSFIYETLRNRVNCPSNETYWLPKKLQELDKSGGGGRLLPIKGADWQLGGAKALGRTAANTLLKSWWQTVEKPGVGEHQPIVKPGATPQLTFKTVAVQGLSNVKARPTQSVTQPDFGYRAVLPLEFGAYAAGTKVQAGMHELGPVRFGGKIAADPAFVSTFQLTLDVCSGPAGPTVPTKCDDFAKATINGHGTYEITATGLVILATAEISLSGSGPDRQLEVKVPPKGLSFSDQPELSLTEIKIQGAPSPLFAQIWQGAAEEAFGQASTQKAMVSGLEAELNKPNNLNQLNEMLTTQMRRALDSAFGAVPSGTLPTDKGPQAKNPVDQYLFDRIRLAVNNPKSQLYLPAQLLEFTKPQLEPFKLASAKLPEPISGGGVTLKHVTLTDMVVSGLSNIQSPEDKMVFNPNGVLDSTLVISTLERPPAPSGVPLGPLTATGKFTFESGGTTSPPADFKLTVRQSHLASQLRADGTEVEDLTLTFLSVVLGTPAIPPGDKPDYWASIKITNAQGMGQVLTDVINDTPGAISSMLSGLNSAAKNNLEKISESATKEFVALIKSKLDG